MWPAYPTAVPPPPPVPSSPAYPRLPACLPASLPIPLKPRFLTNWCDPRVTRHIRRHFSCLAEHRPSSVPAAAAGSGWSRLGLGRSSPQTDRATAEKLQTSWVVEPKNQNIRSIYKAANNESHSSCPSPSLGILLTPTQLYAILYWWAVWRTAFI